MTSYPESDGDLAARKTLKRYQRAATGLLVGMGGLTVVGYAAPAAGWVKDGFWLEMLRAGARAGVVGGLADWFAVVALFRHPMGLPIPHTAILPAQKERLGRALGRFVSGQVFTEKEIARVLEQVDIPTFLANMLDDPATRETLTRSVLASMPKMLDRLEDGRASGAIGKIFPRLLGNSNLAPIVARALRSLVDDDRHQEVLSFLLSQIKDGLQAREGALRDMIEERVREQGGRLLGWAIGGSIATRVLMAASKELERVDPQNSTLREGFTTWVRSQIDRIETDPERGSDISQAIMGVLSHESVVSWWADIWQRFRRLVEADVEDPDGRIASLVEEGLTHITAQLREDPVMRQRIMASVDKATIKALPFVRERMADFIARVVAGWDAVQIAEKLELRVGKDLQYVRFNGTLVGFGVGALLFAVLRLLFGLNAQ
ncbi:DUF445 domain-containing protein [Acetobacter malorum]|uniref:DUF445 domain-containing protein n=1 Tax=Acetobacter malorum TaxID=178901 RepID=A0A087PSI6_9PROT|nr:DUF445 domain-containing protein [Acetobacter malorum]KFL90339.1 hypothetical protein AmDm5_1195 [Acetobacter malorum]KXV67604.1 hypothetical protein AD951_15320 [Acetobacter malorum]